MWSNTIVLSELGIDDDLCLLGGGNHSALRISRKSVPLKRSLHPLSRGNPEQIWVKLIPTFLNQSCIAVVMNFEPLSERVYSRFPHRKRRE